MVHVVYDVNTKGYFTNQRGEGPYFEGMRFQRGYGRRQYGRGLGAIGGLLGRAWRYLLPMAKQYVGPIAREAVKAIGEEGISAGHKILDEVGKGVDVREAITTEGTQALKNLANRAARRVSQKGSGVRKKKKPPKKLTAAIRRGLGQLDLVGTQVLESAAKRKRLQNTIENF